jgi:hypothetical protein
VEDYCVECKKYVEIKEGCEHEVDAAIEDAERIMAEWEERLKYLRGLRNILKT